MQDKLHTDFLEQKYGPIHAVVLRHENMRKMKKGEEGIREARLVDEKDILRTYALTFLSYDRNHEEIARIDDEIRHGGLIGKTFKEHGYAIRKNVIDVYMMKIPSWMQNDFRVDAQEAQAKLVEFYVKKESSIPVLYGTILEVYSPDFKDSRGGVSDDDLAQVNPSIDILPKIQSLHEKISHYLEAKEVSTFSQ